VALPDDQQGRLRCYRNALRNWNYTGYVEFKKLAQEWLLQELSGLSLDDIRRELHDFVDQGGVIDEQVERRPEYLHYQFHFDLRVTIGHRRVYFETVLICDDPADPDDPLIIVVSVHDV
jgi:hypothetical protein